MGIPSIVPFWVCMNGCNGNHLLRQVLGDTPSKIDFRI